MWLLDKPSGKAERMVNGERFMVITSEERWVRGHM